MASLNKPALVRSPRAPGGIYDAEAHYLDFVDSHLIVQDVVM